MIFIFWIVLSLFIGFVGSSRKIGFFGAFALSLFPSPIIGLIFTVISKSNEDVARENKMLKIQQQQASALEEIKNASSAADPELKAAKFKELRDKGIITQEEFMEHISRL